MTRNKEAQAAMSARKLFYLGPQGTFTHQAAVNASQALAHLEPEGFELVAADDVPQILDAAQRGEDGGVVGMGKQRRGLRGAESGRAHRRQRSSRICASGRRRNFDAYVRAGSNPEDATVATAHAHGLAQCKRFIAEHHLEPTPAPSNAAACRDIKETK